MPRFCCTEDLRALARSLIALAWFIVLCPSLAFADDIRRPDAVARYLAGMAPSDDYQLAGLRGEPGWQRHAEIMDAAWEPFELRSLRPIRAWSGRELRHGSDVLLYPFSGPDVLFADAFHGQATTIVLAGKEPVGPLPLINPRSAGARLESLSGLRRSIRTALQYGFFRTQDMKDELGTRSVPGVLPILYVFLARTGHEIRSAELVKLSRDGRTDQTAEGGNTAGDDGVRIVFGRADGPARTLFYFRTDLSNTGMKRSGFSSFVTTLGSTSTLIKSASYLMHLKAFSRIRDLILSSSTIVVQDDSGIPLRYFREADWALKPFGRYSGAHHKFPDMNQRDLTRLYARGRVSVLTFGIGYRWRPEDSNLLLGIKRTDKPEDSTHR